MSAEDPYNREDYAHPHESHYSPNNPGSDGSGRRHRINLGGLRGHALRHDACGKNGAWAGDDIVRLGRQDGNRGRNRDSDRALVMRPSSPLYDHPCGVRVCGCASSRLRASSRQRGRHGSGNVEDGKGKMLLGRGVRSPHPYILSFPHTRSCRYSCTCSANANTVCSMLRVRCHWRSGNPDIPRRSAGKRTAIGRKLASMRHCMVMVSLVEQTCALAAS